MVIVVRISENILPCIVGMDFIGGGGQGDQISTTNVWHSFHAYLKPVVCLISIAGMEFTCGGDQRDRPCTILDMVMMSPEL